MSLRTTVVAVSLLSVLIPGLASGQTPAPAPGASDTGRRGRERLSLEVAAGPTLYGGYVLSATFGYSPASRLELRLNVEREHLPFERSTFPGGYSLTRGGTLTFVSGELRLALLPASRVSPFAVVGLGGGTSRPNVNAQFPNQVTNDLRVGYVGGGVLVPLSRTVSLFGDVRLVAAAEGGDGLLAMWPVRAGVAFRF